MTKRYKNKYQIAYHEAGHALIGKESFGIIPNIISRDPKKIKEITGGNSLGICSWYEDTIDYKKEVQVDLINFLINDLKIIYAGTLGENIFCCNKCKSLDLGDLKSSRLVWKLLKKKYKENHKKFDKISIEKILVSDIIERFHKKEKVIEKLAKKLIKKRTLSTKEINSILNNEKTY
jgi:hypothetical protein